MHLLDLLDSHPGVQRAADRLADSSRGPSHLQITGVHSPAWAVVAAKLQQKNGCTLLLVTPDGETAERCTNDLRALFELADEDNEAPDVFLFPIPERAGVEDIDGDRSATQDRLSTLDALHHDKPVIVVSTANALAHPTLPPKELRHGYDE
ncbi:MAG TPA: hypothetical protein VF719_00150, partial [Abditibacteriaceae bacterium]